jgi:hypothetical protein
MGRTQPVVTLCDFSTMTASHADLIRYLPESYGLAVLFDKANELSQKSLHSRFHTRIVA